MKRKFRGNLVGFVTLLAFFIVGTSSFGKAQKIVIWHAENEDFMKTELEKFAKSSGIDLVVERQVVSKFKGILVTAVNKGAGPDIALVPADFVGLKDQLQLSVIPKADIAADSVIQNSWYNTTTLQDKNVYGHPITGGNHLMLYYNKKFVKKAPEKWSDFYKPETWQKERPKNVIGWNYNEMYWFAPFVGAFGSWPITDYKITLNDKGMAEALEFYKAQADNGLISEDCNYDCNSVNFFKGDYAFAINGDWAYKETKEALKENFGVAKIPSIKGKTVTPMFSSKALIFPRKSLDSDKKASLKKLVAHMQGVVFQTALATKLNNLPVQKAAMDKFHSVADDNMKALLSQLDVAKPMPSIPEMVATWEGMRKGFNAYKKGKIDSAKAAKLMQKSATKLHKRSEKKSSTAGSK
ncbi:MAG: extracellular solute-binding protein [Pseudobacteriovorax sp.]|nr:extracellular solute-binding protein [Pseudobacteriovorax sp.]